MYYFHNPYRKPVAAELMESAPVVPPEVKASSPRPEPKDEVPSPKVESFPVEWPTTQTADSDSQVPQKSMAAVVAGAPEVAPVYLEEGYDRKEEKVVTPMSEQPTLPPGATQEKAEEDHQPLDPASQYLLSIYNYWAARQQELLACQQDLKSRIRSQEAEIARIEVSISSIENS